ncbi:MAG: hypothetical protein JW833_14640 [Prolixibacteraceae bacterium]|nr:hypothetical protein [Prolixibacteraceae bacterium]
MKKEIYILGVGPYSIVIAELAQICGFEVKGFYHYNNKRNGEIYYNIPIISSTSELLKNDLTGKNFGLSMSDNMIRLDIAKQIRLKGGNIPSLIHPTVEISPSATIEDGIILKRNVSIQADSHLKRECIICDNTTICHHTTIAEGCFIAGAAVIGAYTNMERNVFIGQGAIISSGKVAKLGESAVIGAGSVVINDVEPFNVVAGNPARVIKINQI